jgi:predicted metal-binding membrane protein
MFAVGVGNLAWMLALAVVMGIEKNLSWGRQISVPVGVVLLTAGLTVTALNLS